MLTVVDRPLIQYVVDEAREAGHRALHLRHRPQQGGDRGSFRHPGRARGDAARARQEAGTRGACRDLPHAGPMSFTRQQAPLGLGHAVWCARELVGDEPFAVLLPDMIMRGKPGCLAQMVEVYSETGGNVIAVEECDPAATDQYGIVGVGETVGDAFQITAMVEKPKPADGAVEPLHQRPLHPAAGDLRPPRRTSERGAGNEIQLTDAMIRLAETQPFYGCRFRGRTFDCGYQARLPRRQRRAGAEAGGPRRRPSARNCANCSRKTRPTADACSSRRVLAGAGKLLDRANRSSKRTIAWRCRPRRSGRSRRSRRRREGAAASALRTIRTERKGLTALAAALDNGLAGPFAAAVELIHSGARPRHRQRHRQERSYRPQDRRDPRLDRHAGLLRPPRRGEPRRSRHDHAGRRHPRAVLVRRDRGTPRASSNTPRRFRIPLIAMTAAPESTLARKSDIVLGAAAGDRGLPARPRADDLDADAARARRRARHRAPRKPRLHRGELPRLPPRRPARRQPPLRPRHHAPRRCAAAVTARHADERGDPAHHGEGVRLPRHRRWKRRAGRHRHRRRPPPRPLPRPSRPARR